jgi:hypothetical protein
MPVGELEEPQFADETSINIFDESSGEDYFDDGLANEMVE